MRRAKYTEKLPLTLTPWQRKELGKAAEQRDMSCAHLVRVAIGQYLSNDSITAAR